MEHDETAIKRITDVWRRTSAGNSSPKRAERVISPEARERTARLEDIKNKLTYPADEDVLK